MSTFPSLLSSRAEARLSSLLSGMCLICFMALMSSETLITVSLGTQPAHGTSPPRACSPDLTQQPSTQGPLPHQLGTPGQRGQRDRGHHSRADRGAEATTPMRTAGQRPPL